MKNVAKTFILTMLMVLCIGAVCVSAASAESKVKKVTNKMKNYELALLYEMANTLEGTKVINLNKDHKGRAAALSLEYSSTDIVVNTDQGVAKLIEYKVDSTRFQKAGINLFGKKLKLKNISSVVNNGTFDAYKTRDFGVIVHKYVYDTNMAYQVNEISIKKKNGKYIVDKKVYFGPKSDKKKVSNFNFRYSVEPYKKSAFGYVIKGMKMTKL